MEIMTTSLSNEIRSSEELLSVAKKDVMDAHQAAVQETLSKEENMSLPLKSSKGAVGTSEIPSSYVESSTISGNNGISQGDDTVDSALLCAMRDQRERVALLRLEQTYLDFMREETTGYIEVGGPSNSVVISPSGNIGKAQLEQAPGRQTTFQRLCLHRLADRFNIVREMNTGVEGMIRLVKVKESRIPGKLLIDLEPSEYALPGENDGANVTSSPDVAVRGLTRQLTDSSISGRSGKQPQKMKIMKRSSSSFGSSNSLKGPDNQGKGSSSRNRKKLTDKEKAYAEARARIFNESGGGDASADTATTSDPADPDVKPSPVVTPTAASTPLPTPPETTPSSPCPREEQVETVMSSSEQLDEDFIRKKPVGVSKVTWRNRRQEENDPDFQRMAGPPASHYAAVHDAYVAPLPPLYGYSQPYFPGSQLYAGQQYVPGTASPQTYAAATPVRSAHYASEPPQQLADAYYAPSATSYYQGQSGGRGWEGTVQSAMGGEEKQQANVHSLDEFPSLR